MNLIQRSAWHALRWQQARRHSWERTSEPHRDGSDQPKIGDIAGEAELSPPRLHEGVQASLEGPKEGRLARHGSKKKGGKPEMSKPPFHGIERPKRRNG